MFALNNFFSNFIDAKGNKYSPLIMLVYSKAFDSINHAVLLAKVKYYGFDENITGWVRLSLDSRLQVTQLEIETTNLFIKSEGISQESCLGPVLFNFYMADLPNCVQNCSAHLYADDSQLHLSCEPALMSTSISLTNSNLNNILKWSDANGFNSTRASVL